jgi:hypothetical protein
MGRRDDALRDLNRAIELAATQHTRVAGQAYTQRGILHRLSGDEDAALNDFSKGASMGNALAKKEAAALNPAAKLCHLMVQEAMKPYLGNKTE